VDVRWKESALRRDEPDVHGIALDRPEPDVPDLDVQDVFGILVLIEVSRDANLLDRELSRI
jgi:hypothetical protein